MLYTNSEGLLILNHYSEGSLILVTDEYSFGGSNLNPNKKYMSKDAHMKWNNKKLPTIYPDLYTILQMDKSNSIRHPLSAVQNTEIGSYKLVIKLYVFLISAFCSAEHGYRKLQVSNKTFCISNFCIPHCRKRKSEIQKVLLLTCNFRFSCSTLWKEKV